VKSVQDHFSGIRRHFAALRRTSPPSRTSMMFDHNPRSIQDLFFSHRFGLCVVSYWSAEHRSHFPRVSKRFALESQNSLFTTSTFNGCELCTLYRRGGSPQTTKRQLRAPGPSAAGAAPHFTLFHTASQGRHSLGGWALPCSASENQGVNTPNCAGSSLLSFVGDENDGTRGSPAADLVIPTQRAFESVAWTAPHCALLPFFYWFL